MPTTSTVIEPNRGAGDGLVAQKRRAVVHTGSRHFESVVGFEGGVPSRADARAAGRRTPRFSGSGLALLAPPAECDRSPNLALANRGIVE